MPNGVDYVEELVGDEELVLRLYPAIRWCLLTCVAIYHERKSRIPRKTEHCSII